MVGCVLVYTGTAGWVAVVALPVCATAGVVGNWAMYKDT